MMYFNFWGKIEVIVIYKYYKLISKITHCENVWFNDYVNKDELLEENVQQQEKKCPFLLFLYEWFLASVVRNCKIQQENLLLKIVKCLHPHEGSGTCSAVVLCCSAVPLCTAIHCGCLVKTHANYTRPLQTFNLSYLYTHRFLCLKSLFSLFVQKVSDYQAS